MMIMMMVMILMIPILIMMMQALEVNTLLERKRTFATKVGYIDR